jgi:large subunit ribosomal protein L4
MKTQVVDLKNNGVGEIELDDAIFAAEVREHLFWEVINWQRAKRRRGTSKVKGRSEVRGGGKKPWRQKGTGRARQGSIRASQWVGGGTVHGPKPKDHSYKLNKKTRRAALISALSLKAQSGQLRVVDALSFDAPSTKGAAGALVALEAPKALVVDVTTHTRDEATGKPTSKPVHNENLRLSVRNLKNAKYIASEGLNVEDLIRYDVLVISREAVERVQEALKS